MLRHVHEKKLHLQWWNWSLLHKATVISLSERYHPHTYTGFHVKLPFAFDKNSRKDLGPNGWGIAYNATFKDRKKGTYGVFGLRNEVVTIIFSFLTFFVFWFVEWNGLIHHHHITHKLTISICMRNMLIPPKFMWWTHDAPPHLVWGGSSNQTHPYIMKMSWQVKSRYQHPYTSISKKKERERDSIQKKWLHKSNPWFLRHCGAGVCLDA